MTTPADTLWYFGYGSNMNPAIFVDRRGMRPLEIRWGWLEDYRLRFNIPVGPGERGVANVESEPGARTCGVAYLLTVEQAGYLVRRGTGLGSGTVQRAEEGRADLVRREREHRLAEEDHRCGSRGDRGHRWGGVRRRGDGPRERCCLDLLQAKQEALDRGVPFPLAPGELCDRCQSLFATLDLTQEACHAIGRGELPPAVRDLLRRRLAAPSSLSPGRSRDAAGTLSLRRASQGAKEEGDALRSV